MTLISVKEAAALVGISERAIQKRIAGGKLEAQKVPGVGGNGNIWMVDRDELNRGIGRENPAPTVDQLAKTNELTNEPAKNSSLIPMKTNEPTNEPVKPCMSVVPIKRNKRKKDSDLWLSFVEVLELYRVMAERSNCNTPRLECYKSQEVKLISTTNEPLQDKKTDTNELLPCVSSKKLQDKTLPANFSIFDQKNKKRPNDTANLQDIFQQTNEPAENQKDYWYGSEYKKLRRDIDSGILTTRKDPDDLRKTQILFNSLSAAYQSLWRLLRIPGVEPSSCNQENGIRIGSLTIYNNERSDNEDVKKQVTANVKQQLMTGLEKIPPTQFWDIIDDFCNYYQTNRTTVWRWWSAYKQAGNALGVLERKRSSKLGRRSIDELPLHIKERFWYLVAAHPKRNCQNAAAVVLHEHGLELTKRQIYELKKDKQGAIYLANLQKHYPQHARFINFFTPQDRKQNRPLEIVTSDGHDCDIFVKHPVSGEPFRPVLLEIRDVASGMTLGWALGERENLQLCNMALIDAILKFGWFSTLAVDCGKAFWKSAERRRRIYDMLHISVVSKQGYSPHQKAHQERNFGEFERHVCMQLPGYIGNSIANRTRASVSQDVKAVLTFDQFHEKVAYYFNNIMPNLAQGGLGGMTAAQFWKECEQERQFKIKMFPGDAKSLLMAFNIALGEQTEVTIRRSVAAFSHNKVKYFFHNPLLVGMETERISVIFNPNQLVSNDPPAKVYIFKNNRFLCEAEKIVVKGVGVVSEQITKMKIETRSIRKQLLNYPMWNQQADMFKLHMAAYPQVSFTPDSEFADISDTELNEMLPALQGQIEENCSSRSSNLISDEVQNMDIFAASGDAGMNELFAG